MALWDSAVERYKAGEPATAIARDMGVSYNTVYKRLREAGVEVRPGKFQRKGGPQRSETTCTHCGTGFSYPKHQPRRRFCSVECRNAVKGAAHWNQGQDRVLRDTGYWYVRSADPTRRKAWIAEHVLTAERVLGRRLKPSEVVHHINCDPSDNRPQNLLICTRDYHGWLHGEMSRRWAQTAFGGAS